MIYPSNNTHLINLAEHDCKKMSKVLVRETGWCQDICVPQTFCDQFSDVTIITNDKRKLFAHSVSVMLRNRTNRNQGCIFYIQIIFCHSSPKVKYLCPFSCTEKLLKLFKPVLFGFDRF